MIPSILTNEEKLVEIYATEDKPTISHRVTADTPLEELNLNWREKDLPERERTKHVHRFHPYLGKYIPQLVEIFLRKYFKPGQIVLDPFCGSGTTLVQANELGINSIGFDISEFNVLLSRVKTAKYDINIVHKEIYDILEKVRAVAIKDGQIDFWELQELSFSAETDSDYLKRWFAPQALKELMMYKSLIETEKYEYKNLLKVILSRSARSSRLTTHFDLDFPKQPQTEPYWCYKHSRTCSPTSEAYKFLRRYSIDTFNRLKEFDHIRTDAQVIVNHVDSRIADIPPVDGVITSPPYVGLIDYHEQHAYSYELLGLKDNRQNEIGPAANGSSIKAKELYQNDIAEVFRRIASSMKPGGSIIVVAGDKANLYPRIAEIADLETESVVKRHVNRRTGRRSTQFYESVFIWKK
jgi:DNA modification methylase